MLLAISADEAWVGASRFLDGTWTAPVTSDSTPETRGVRATDGAVWFVLSTGLTRMADEKVTVVADDVTSGALTAGSDGSVWVVVDGNAVRVDPSGTRDTIGHPDSGEIGCLLAGGPDGSLWVDTGCPSSPVSILARRDGTAWNPIEMPDPDVWLSGLTIADDGHRVGGIPRRQCR